MRALLAALFLLLAAAPAAQAAFPGRNGRIALGLSGSVAVMNPDGSGVKRVAGRNSFDPRWSPDGTRLAYVKGVDGGGYGIFAAASDGGGARRVPLPFSAYAPAWSPDGERLVVQRNREGDVPEGDLYRVAPDGSGLKRLVADAVEGSWSPDGRSLAYVSVAQNQCRRLAVASADGTRRSVVYDGIPAGANCASARGRTVLKQKGAVFSPDWRPDGKAIVFGSGRKAIELDVATKRTRVLWRSKARVGAKAVTNVVFPRISPDGKRLAFSDGTFNRWTAWTVALGSTKRTRLGAGVDPDWQPLP